MPEYSFLFFKLLEQAPAARKHVITIRTLPSDTSFIVFPRRFHRQNTYGGSINKILIQR